MYGADFGYVHLRQFAEAGRACCEYLLSKAEERGINVEVAMTTTMFDAQLCAMKLPHRMQRRVRKQAGVLRIRG